MAELSEPLGRSRNQRSEPKANILLVDDNPANLLVLRSILDSLGHNLVDAHSGDEALERVLSDEFAIVLLDVNMPGISGFETAKLIRGRNRSRHIPIIFLTANDIDRSQIEEGYALGAVDFLVKPILPVVLQAKVRGLVELFEEKQRAKRAAEQLRLLVDGTREYAIFMLDAKGHILTWNSGAERINQYRAEEIIGQHFSRFYTQKDIDRGWPAHELMVADKEGRFEDEGWRVRKDGAQFWANVIITALRDELGNLRGFSKITRDVTERRKAEEAARRLVEESAARRVAEENARIIQAQGAALEESEERFRGLMEQAPFSVQVFSPDGRTLRVNRVWEELWGITLDQIADYNILEDAQLEAKGVSPYIRRAFAGESVAIPAIQYDPNETLPDRTRHEDSRRWVSAVAYPLKDGAGRIREVVLVHDDITARKCAEEERHQSDQRTRIVLESITDAFFAVDRDWRFAYVNPQAERLLDRKPGDLLGQIIWEVYPGLIGSEFEKVYRRVATERITLSVTSYYPDHDRWYETHVYPAKDGVSIYFQDVSERKRAEAELDRLTQASEQQRRIFDTALSNSADFNYVFDLEGRFAYVNKPLLSLWGKELSEAVGKNFFDLEYPPDLAARLQRQIQEVINTKQPVKDETPYTSGVGERQYEYIFVPVVGSGGIVEAVAGSTRDITERKRTEVALQESVRLYRAIGESIDYGVWVCDPQGRNIFASESFLRLIGMTQEECSSFGWGSVLHPDDADPTITAWKECVQTGGRWDREHRFKSADGQWHYVLARGVPVKNEAGEITAWVGINLDISRLKNVEGELRNADRRKDEFLATLAHELRNPLAPIRNSLQILKMPRIDAATAQATREMMERQVHHLVRLVDDLLDVSRVMRGKIELRKERVELATVVARAVETAQPLIEVQGHRLEISLPSESLLLDADPVRLAQVIGNLLTNAAKYTEANGRVWLTAERENDHAVLKVRDNGIGIAPDMLPHIFELFVQVDHAATRSQGGLGIGLTLVKNLVEMHGGTVEADSAGLGNGSEFIVRLALIGQEQREPNETANGEQQQGPATSGNRLLVVDDNKDAATSLAMLLRLQGHEVRVAYDGASALAIAPSYRPDMVFLDIGMPGMDGYEVARQMRRTPGLEKILLAALTGWGQQEDRRRSKEAGFNYHLVKPVDPVILEKLLAGLKTPTS